MKMKRVLAFFLCVAMVVSIMPAVVFAAGTSSDPIYVIAGGDYQEGGDPSNSANNINNIIAQVKAAGYDTMDGFIFVGDYDCETHGSTTDTTAGINSLMSTMNAQYSTLTHETSSLVQGNHDAMVSGIDATGGYDHDGYSVYVINEDDYPDSGGTQTGIRTLAANLETWLNLKLAEGYDDPIFIVSHLPLAFSPRTVVKGDAKYAKYLFDVMNNAADEGLNLFYLHGHDHAYGCDNYLGGEALYRTKGDELLIANPDAPTTWTTETLNFTYMNAGYTGYYSDTAFDSDAGTEKLTMSVFEITQTGVKVMRFSENGLYNMSVAGRDGFYGDSSVTASSLGLPFNTLIYTSPQTIELVTNSTSEDAGTIGVWVEVAAGEITEDVTVSGEWTTITEEVSANPGQDASHSYKYTLDQNGVDNGTPYLIVASGSNYAMTGNGSIGSRSVNAPVSNVITSDTQYGCEWTIDANGRISNGTYWLTASPAWNGCSIGVTTNESNAYEWNISNNNGTYSISAISSGYFARTYYLYYTNGSFAASSDTSDRVRLYSMEEVDIPAVAPTEREPGLYGKLDGELVYTVAYGTDAATALQKVKDGIDVKYATYANYSDETLLADDDAEGMSWVLESSYGDGTVPGDYAVTVAYNGTVIGTAKVIVPAPTTYYIAEGNGLYAVAMNTTATAAMNYVKSGVTVYSATDANGANKKAISDDDVTWNWVDTYSGTENGPYTVEILKDGVSLGTVEVKVDVRYESGIVDGWVEAGTTNNQYKYVLDTNGIDYGSNNKYLIVGYESATSTSYDYALTANGSSTGALAVDIENNTITLNTNAHEWYFATGLTNTGSSTYNTFITQNGTTWLYHTNSSMYVGNGSDAHRGYWRTGNQGNGIYRFRDQDGSDWNLRYSASGGKFTVSTSTYYVRLYKYDSMTPGSKVYAHIEGNTSYSVPVGSSATAALNAVKKGITAYLSTNADGSNASVLEDSKLTWTWKNKFNGSSTGTYWVDISYNGVYLGTVQVNVVPGVVDNYPEYPNEGAVKVNKTATGIDFQASGVAQVEVSASGVPVQKGIDVVVVVDTSSSMTRNTITTNGVTKTRLAVLQESMEDMIDSFNVKDASTGLAPDIEVAIMDFNGYGTEYAHLIDGTWDNTDHGQVFTGNHLFADAGAFVSASDLLSFDVAANIYNTPSGTNYDGALRRAYYLLQAKATQNETLGDVRDQYVIFLSDGAPFGWNGIIQSDDRKATGYYWWNHLLQGTYTSLDAMAAAAENHSTFPTTDIHTEFDFLYDGNGKTHPNRWAEAIKGDPSTQYTVLDTVAGSTAVESDLDKVYGAGATVFSIGFGLAEDTRQDDDGDVAGVTVETMTELLETIASEDDAGNDYYWACTDSDQLTSAFSQIVSKIRAAATNARFVDQMGESFNLQMETETFNPTGSSDTTQTITPSIEIISYDIWTRSDYLNHLCTLEQIGVRKGTSTTLETITFSADGKEAYSDKILDADGNKINILADGSDPAYIKGVIYAKTFLYNTNKTEVAIDGIEIPIAINANGTTSTALTNKLPSETFYWKMGTVESSELAMRYYVYLDGSMEGTKPAGSYATNEFATLYYDNYLENPCYKDTVSPQLGWKEGNVSYAFYLVNSEGEVIVNQATGETGTFANKVAVTNPVVYDTVLLNNVDNVRALEVKAIAGDVLPKYYDLYDEAAAYEITINSNSTGEWTITKDSSKVNSTYVTNHSLGSDYSNALTENDDAYDYTHTVVWFAVVWSLEAHPDTVVVDYGLPVDITVLSNDMFGNGGHLEAVRTEVPWMYDSNGQILQDEYGYNRVVEYTENILDGFGSSCIGTYGIATVNASTNKVTYQLNNSNGMQMSTYDQFAYAVHYTGDVNYGYYYDTVTIIPATNIYYEDSFLSYGGTATWKDEGSAVTGVKQDEDRPGKYSLSDANNIYGKDSINYGMSAFSLGTAKMVTVTPDTYATAEFTFSGTGFDVVSMTSSDTGVLVAQVYNTNGTPNDTSDDTLVTSKFVNSYYGVRFDGTDWVPSTDLVEGASQQIWQVPLLKFEGLTYGTYRVKLTASYYKNFDENYVEGGNNSYDLYIDAIRIYDPANDGTQDSDNIIEDAYLADGEGWPSYIELRNAIISAGDFDNDDGLKQISGIVFIDGDNTVGNDQIADYISYGPNNEVYLLPGQSVAFMLDMPNNTKNIHIGVKSADGNVCTYSFKNIAKADIGSTKRGEEFNEMHFTVNTTTDMFYDLTNWRTNIIVISNIGQSGILSLTNIKATYSSNPTTLVSGATSRSAAATEMAVENLVSVYMTSDAAALTLKTLNTPAPAPSVPEIPENPEPGITEPEATEPEVTEPEATEPEATEPDATEPEATNPGNKHENGKPGNNKHENGKPGNNKHENNKDNKKEDDTSEAPKDEEPVAPDQDVPVEDDSQADVPNDETADDSNASAEPLTFWQKIVNFFVNAFRWLCSWLNI